MFDCKRKITFLVKSLRFCLSNIIVEIFPRRKYGSHHYKNIKYQESNGIVKTFRQENNFVECKIEMKV